MKRIFQIMLLFTAFAGSSINAIGFTAWGGYAITSKPNICNQNFFTSGVRTNSKSCETGGLEFGAEIWLANLSFLQIGVGGSYNSHFDAKEQKETLTGAEAGLISTYSASSEITQVLMHFRIELGLNFYSQLAAGLALTNVKNSGTEEGGVLDFTVDSNKTQQSFAWAGQLGYALKFGIVQFEVFGRFSMVFADINTVWHRGSFGDGTPITITPGAAVTFLF